METYLTLSQSEDNHGHIATLRVDRLTSEEFREKLIFALNEHFDSDVLIPESTTLNVDDYIHGRSGTVGVMVEYEGEFALEEIFICQTWIY